MVHTGRLPVVALGGCAVLTILGVIGFSAGLGTNPVRAWQAYLVNFLYFTGLGVGGMLFVCALNLSSGRWGRNVKRVAEGLGAFVPVSFVLFLIMIPGFKRVLPWATNPYGPSWWLDVNLVAWRDGLCLLGLALLAAYMVYLSLRSDFGHVREAGNAAGGLLERMLTLGWKGAKAESDLARRRLALLSPIYGIAFACVLTVFAVDFIMSLKKNWYSTLLGGYFFVTCFYASLAALLIAVIWARRRFGLHREIVSKHLHDIAKLTMGFAIVSGDFFYTQFLVIWYGNLPFETSFIVDRTHGTAWRYVGVAVLLLCFALPLIATLRKGLKERSGPMLVFAVGVLAALWMERLFLVGPSVLGTASIPFGITEILVTLGFLGLLGLTFVTFMHLVPPVVIHDPVLDRAEEAA